MSFQKQWLTTDESSKSAKPIVKRYIPCESRGSTDSPFAVRPIQEYAKSCLQVAEYHMGISDGDLYLAKEYLERVASSNAEDVMKATELLKTVKSALQARDDNGGGLVNQISQRPEGGATKGSELGEC
jgi:hypothetical protein